MKYSFIIHSNTLIIDLRAEQLFANLEFNETVELNIYLLKTIKSECIRNIISEIKTTDNRGFDNVIIDFSGIENSHNLEFEVNTLLEYLKGNLKNIYCVGITGNLYEEQLKLNKIEKSEEIKESISNERENKSDEIIPNGLNNKVRMYFSIVNNAKSALILGETFGYKHRLFSDLLYEKLKTDKKYFGEKKDKISNSSDVYLDKYVNIKAFIEERSISLYGLFLLAEKLSTHFTFDEINEHSLFTMSINGSYLASILSKLLGIKISYLDHLGPINKIYKTHLDVRIHGNHKYLLVSDVICLGTEIKIAESIINYENSVVNGSITIVNIKTTSKTTKYPLFCLFEINRETNEHLNYTIRTELTKS